MFSEDYITDELREHEYKIVDNIENEISVDSEIIMIKETAENLETALSTLDAHQTKLVEAFKTAKDSELATKAKVSKNLEDYKELTLDAVLQANTEKPEGPSNSLSDIRNQLDTLKTIPAEPGYPEAAASLMLPLINVSSISHLLSEAVSPSEVADVFKQKVEADHDFYKAGVARVSNHKLDDCPFCEQPISTGEPKALIDNFIAYFNDAEEKHHTALKDQLLNVEDAHKKVDDIEELLASQRVKFDKLKVFLPSQSGKSLDMLDQELQCIKDDLEAIKINLHIKLKAIALPIALDEHNLDVYLKNLNDLIEGNNTICADLNRAIGSSDKERRTLQRNACSAYSIEFVIKHWTSIETLNALKQKRIQLHDQLEELKRSGPSKHAKDRVADTFELLLKEFFGGKYVFDKTSFALKRGDNDMTRGPHRTLSDGEKTAIAFCYFIAAIHKRFMFNSDYEKLFMVFDDPVTSMSYDYVFAIAQTLKNLSISKQGEISVNSSKIDSNKSPRPQMLVLTHSSYFFNVARANKVIKAEATFALSDTGKKHKITQMNKYVAPFDQQLEHVYRIAEGAEPDHSTGNCIRSVIEAVGRFCRPDKSSLQDFITFLAGEDKILIKSTLVQSLSHGTYYDDTPTDHAITLACKEAIEVVELYAPGHLSLLKKADK